MGPFCPPPARRNNSQAGVRPMPGSLSWTRLGVYDISGIIDSSPVDDFHLRLPTPCRRKSPSSGAFHHSHSTPPPQLIRPASLMTRHNVGLRPSRRGGPRLEREELQLPLAQFPGGLLAPTHTMKEALPPTQSRKIHVVHACASSALVTNSVNNAD